MNEFSLGLAVPRVRDSDVWRIVGVRTFMKLKLYGPVVSLSDYLEEAKGTWLQPLSKHS